MRWSALILVFPIFFGSCANDPESQRREEIKHLAATIDLYPDMFHGNYTPSVHKLIQIGMPALPRMFDLMESDDPFTRMRAVTVVSDVISILYGWVPGHGDSDPTTGDRVGALWQKLGGYREDMPKDQRDQAVALWRAWYKDYVAQHPKAAMN